ncbi:MAG: hypothetical protein HQL26_10865 [Candidatus Omnitrophica bacterium]|nr:hypothetical protein [Candidatus Omnitrophota bacterium]
MNLTRIKDDNLEPALELSLIEMAQPNSPMSPMQKHRLTEKGKLFFSRLEGKK